MDLLLLTLLVLVVNGLIFWVYYIRTKRIIWKVHENEYSWRQLLSRVEHRLSNPLPYWSREGEGIHVWAVVFTYQRLDLLQRTIRSLRLHEPTIKIMVVDNGSKDDSRIELSRMLQAREVDKLLLNTHGDVPQWQKAFSFHQAVNVLSIEPMSHMVFLDDDVEVRAPFLSFALKTLEELEPKRVTVVSLLTDQDQNDVHPTEEIVTIDGHDVRIKRSFNGAFFFLSMDTLDTFGLPPVREGSNEIAAEDWYFSRRLMALESRAACADFAEHIGVSFSQRVNMENS